MCPQQTNMDENSSAAREVATKLPPLHTIQEETPRQQIVHYLLCSLCIITLVFFLPFILPISLMFRIYRSVLTWRIKQVYGDNVDIMSAADSIWQQDSKENRTIINTVIFLKGKADIDLIRQTIETRLINVHDPDNPDRVWFPKIRQYPSQILHRYVWISCQDTFNINQHAFVYHKCMPKTKLDLEVMIGEMTSKSLPSNRPPWQYIVIPPNEETPDEYVVLFRVHHAIADGMSMVKLLLTQIIDEVPPMTIATRPGFGSKGKILRALKAAFVGPYMVIEKLFYRFDNHALHGPPLTGDKLVSWSEPIDLELIKNIKNSTGTTVNDVLVSCLAGAFGTYFRKHSSSPPQDILAYIPVDLRDPRSKPTLDNQFVLVFMQLPTSDESPLTLLDKTRRRMGRIKTSAEPLVNSLIMKYFMARLPNWLSKVTFDMFSRKCSMVLSNVPGYQTKLKLAGETIEDIIFWPPQRSNVGLGVSILSYAGHIRIGVMCDRALLSNPNVLVTNFVQQVQDLTQQLKLD